MVFVINDIIKVPGRGKVLIGQVSNEPISVGDVLSLLDANGTKVQDVTIKGIEKFRQTLSLANVGEHVGLTIDNKPNCQCAKGMSLSKG